jgi:hypothetical protein
MGPIDPIDGYSPSLGLDTGAREEQYRLLFMKARTATRILASRVAVRLSLLVLLLLGILPGGFAA